MSKIRDAWTVRNFGYRGPTDLFLPRVTLSPIPSTPIPGPVPFSSSVFSTSPTGEQPPQSAVGGEQRVGLRGPTTVVGGSAGLDH